MRQSSARAPMSSEAVLTLVLLGVFALITVWLIGRLGHEERMLPALSTYSAQPDGALALFKLLEQEGLKPQRFGDTEYAYPPESCVVVAEAPGSDIGAMLLSPVNAQAVVLWVKNGGRLVLASTPEQALHEKVLEEMNAEPAVGQAAGPDAAKSPAAGHGATAPVVSQQVKAKDIPTELCGTATGTGRPGNAMALSRLYLPGQSYTMPADRPALWRDVQKFETAGSTRALVAARSDALLGTDSPAEAVVVYRRVGRGAVYLLPAPELLANDWLGRADNHRLVLALLAQASQGRALYFDEHIHGFARARHNALSLLLQTRGGHLLLAFAAAVLLLLAGSAVRPARAAREPVPARRQAEEMVLAQADLYQRAQASAAAARWVVDGLRQRVMQAHHLARPPDAAQLAQWARELPAGFAKPARVLLNYLDENQPPETGQAALVRLAQAVSQLKQALG